MRGNLGLLFDLGRLGIYSLNASLSTSIDVFNVFRVLRGEVVEFVGLIDKGRGLVLHIILAGAAYGGDQCGCEANH